MARGTLYVVNAFTETLADGTHDMDTDVFKMALVSDMPSATTTILANVNEVVGTGYTAGGKELTKTWERSGGVTSWKCLNTLLWSRDDNGPDNIKAGVIYNASSVNDDVVCYVDFTENGGVTPISLRVGDVSWTAGAGSVLFKVSV